MSLQDDKVTPRVIQSACLLSENQNSSTAQITLILFKLPAMCNLLRNG